jgi:ankyrin repeat protein
LLTHGMRVQHQSAYDGATPLHRTAQIGNIEIAQILINHGANLNAPNYMGQTALHVALENDNFQATNFAKFLISKGARMKCKPNCMRCQTFGESINKNKPDHLNKKRRNRRHQQSDAQQFYNPSAISQEEFQDHLIVEAEHQNRNLNSPSPLAEPELICKDLKYVNLDEILARTSQNSKEAIPIEDDVSDCQFLDEIK